MKLKLKLRFNIYNDMKYDELYDFINQLFKQYFWKYDLNLDDKKDAIQDVILKIYQKELEGVLSPNLDENKNYIFITLKNQLHAVARVNKRFSPIEIEDNLTTSDIPDFFDVINSKQERDILINYFNENSWTAREMMIIPLVMEGKSAIEISKELEITRYVVHSTISNFKTKIKERFYPTNFKYKLTMYDDGKEYYFKTLKSLLFKTGISPTSWENYVRLGKYKHKNFKINLL